jgi:hypothetical protein
LFDGFFLIIVIDAGLKSVGCCFLFSNHTNDVVESRLEQWTDGWHHLVVHVGRRYSKHLLLSSTNSRPVIRSVAQVQQV